MRHTLALATAVLVMTGGPGWAAPPQTMSTDAGKELRLGVYAVVHKDCSTGSAPEIRITRRPSHGILVLQSVTLSTKRVQNCPTVTAPARQILYRPAAGFAGQDDVTFDVVDSASGQADAHPVAITVQDPAAKP